MTPGWPARLQNSEEAFVADQMILGCAGAGWMMYESDSLESSLQGVLQSAPAWVDLQKKVYRKACAYLQNHLRVAGESESGPADLIGYDRRYGWIARRGAEEVFLGKVTCWDGGMVEVGRRTYFSGSSLLRGQALLQVGSFSSVAEGLYVNTAADRHPLKTASTHYWGAEGRDLDGAWSMDITYPEIQESSLGITIGHDVWIGRNVRIFHGAVVGDGCVIAEGSLVRGTLEPYGLYAGVPARLKRHRFSPEIIGQLRELAWWHWPHSKIMRNARFFQTDLTAYQGSLPTLVV